MNYRDQSPDDPLLPPAAVIFDWDNTLVDSWPNLIRIMNATLAAMGRPTWTPDEAKRRISKSLRDSFPVLFGGEWERAREIFYAELESSHLAMLRTLPDAGRAIGHFRSLGIPLAVVSNKTGDYLRREVAHLGWEPCFAAVYGAGDAPHDKPAPDAVLLFLARLGLAPGRNIWFVGDGLVDMETADAAGCAGVLVREGAGRNPAPPQRAEVDGCRSLIDLADAVLGRRS